MRSHFYDQINAEDYEISIRSFGLQCSHFSAYSFYQLHIARSYDHYSTPFFNLLDSSTTKLFCFSNQRISFINVCFACSKTCYVIYSRFPDPNYIYVSFLLGKTQCIFCLLFSFVLFILQIVMLST